MRRLIEAYAPSTIRFPNGEEALLSSYGCPQRSHSKSLACVFDAVATKWLFSQARQYPLWLIQDSVTTRALCEALKYLSVKLESPNEIAIFESYMSKTPFSGSTVQGRWDR
jgi:hypothetical protein